MTSRWEDVVEGSLSLVLELWRLKRWQEPQITCMMAHSSIISNLSRREGKWGIAEN